MENQTNGKTPAYFISSVEFICVGTELLMGQITNTNASFLAKEMSLIGIPHFYQTVVGDNPARLQKAITDALTRSDAVILTGGLGPTADDITMEIAAKSVGIPLEFHEPSAQKIQAFFNKVNRPMTPNNLKQAMLPKGCIPLPNDNGTAPGAIIETTAGTDAAGEKRKVLVMLPGPPMEMRLMFEAKVRPFLALHAPVEIESRFVRLFGIGESAAETKLRDLIDSQSNPTIAPYCSDGECMFRISATRLRGASPDGENIAQDALDKLTGEVKSRLGEFIYEIGDRSMPKVVFDLLDRMGKTVSFAESCTAGAATSLLGEIPGASLVLRGSVVAYHNDVKRSLLNVPEETLAAHGAVSQETAAAMAKGCKEAMKTDYAVSITGIAGPDGGSDEKPVGLVYIGVSGPGGEFFRTLHLTGNRQRVRTVAALNAYDLLRRTLLDDNGKQGT